MHSPAGRKAASSCRNPPSTARLCLGLSQQIFLTESWGNPVLVSSQHSLPLGFISEARHGVLDEAPGQLSSSDAAW